MHTLFYFSSLQICRSLPQFNYPDFQIMNCSDFHITDTYTRNSTAQMQIEGPKTKITSFPYTRPKKCEQIQPPLCAGTNPLAFFDIASVPPSCSLEFGMESEGLRQNVQGKFHLSRCEKHKGCVHVYTFYTLLVVKPRLRYHWECSSMVEGLLYAA
ncbi:hypothetical protein SORBI_3001G502801 [Sorghum bicolor]|uniref:Uncharacterized protein n=1 Tax=Sorghum bicolor TaxID=4558 RepID=A0A1Z5SBB1_SORBI|nr:hypothetical protein SORBI_3001G502801 [Sorghum bicolor]